MELALGLAPFLALGFGGLLLMLAEALGKPQSPDGIAPDGTVIDAGAGRAQELTLGSAAVLFAGAVASISLWKAGPETLAALKQLEPYLIIDRFTLFFCFVLCLGGGLATLFAGGYLPEHRIERGEFFPLVLFSTLGAMALAASGDLLSLFVSLETMSLGVYCLIGFRRGSARAAEASLKYFLLGSFAAALLLFGGALIYGVTGRTDLAGIGSSLAGIAAKGHTGTAAAVVLGALVLIIGGLAFKVSAVPFHMWTPDAYEGAPTPVTTYMAVAVKSAAFAVLLRVLIVGFGDAHFMSWASGWPPILALMAIITMTFANLVAGQQESVKRMLAYSSIAHAGYALVGVVAAVRSPDAVPSVLFYMLAYTVSTAGAFGALMLCGRQGLEAVSYDDLAGVGRRHPAAALAFSLFLLSLAGAPPTAGFFAKLYVFNAAVGAELYVLTVLGLLNSIIGAYYYLRVLVYMYMREPMPGAPVAVPMRSGFIAAGLVVAALLVLAIGILPDESLGVAHAATIGAAR
jgi:NADH-quinone oxidoreductase subunit N